MKNLFRLLVPIGCLWTWSVQAVTGILAGPVYNPVTTHTYFLLPSNDWTAAEAMAVSMGGHLVTVNDAAENDWIVSTFSSFGGQPRALWIGLNDAAHEGVFVWSSGEPVAYTHWEAYQPDNGSFYYPSENYVMVWPSPGPRSPGYWNDSTGSNMVVNFSFQVYGVVEVTPNTWTNPVSGYWDVATNWSAGLPNSNQSEVVIFNAGSKAVGIQPTTPINFPGAMTVRNLRVGGVPPDVNLLLMNYFDPTTPLRVLNDFNLDANGRVLMLYSGLNVSNAFNLHGLFDQEGGELDFTNSLASIMQIEGGHFNLTNGYVLGKNMYLGGANDGYVNAGGLVSLDWLVLGSKPSVPGSTGGGNYLLRSGWLIVGEHELVGENGFGTLTQKGGTNSTSDLAVGNGTYQKNGGELFAGQVRVLAPSAPIFAPPAGILTHAGGTATISNVLSLAGQGSRSNPRTATFNMFGGTLSTPRIQLDVAAVFAQTNGTVNVANELFIDDNGGIVPSHYYLSGGSLFTMNASVSSSYPDTGSFNQSGGTHRVTDTLWLNGNALYQLSGGTITVPNLVFTGNINNPPQFFVLGGPSFSITNQTISSTGGSIVIQDSAQQFGRLTMSSDSGINLAGNSAILRFADSHTNSWASQLFGVIPRLTVFNWNGSTNGGGTDQLVFGTSSSALTASQVAQIYFVHPAGFAPGTNPARILSSGEVVPMPRPTLNAQRNGTNLVLSWPGNATLQRATNVVGPYFDVSNATSPYSANVHQFPRQFFRLRN